MRNLILGLGAAVALAVPLQAQDFAPENVECIAPANPGGGWDFTCRTVGRLLDELDLVEGTVQTTNMPGASGAVAYANVAADRAGDEDLIVATSTVGITNIAQGRYPAGVDEMRWLAMLGADVAAVMVNQDSEYSSLDGLDGGHRGRSVIDRGRGLLANRGLGPHPLPDACRSGRSAVRTSCQTFAGSSIPAAATPSRS